MKMKLMATTASLAATVAAATALALPAASQAASPGDLCKLLYPAQIAPVLGASYWLPAGSNVRIVDYSGASYYLAHGEGKQDGQLLRSAVNQSTCH